MKIMKPMNIKIVYDNKALNRNFLSGWGFSCFVDNCILFDTGENGDALLHNMEQMDIDMSQIEAVVISHVHWDHTGGLWELLEKRPGLAVYACPGFESSFKNKVKNRGGNLLERNVFYEIKDNIFVTGEIPGEYKGKSMPEQALVICRKEELIVITGCAHPGIVSILERIREKFGPEKAISVLGGFHLNDKSRTFIKNTVHQFREMGVKRVGPTHCSGDKAQEMLRDEFGKEFFDLSAGKHLIGNRENL